MAGDRRLALLLALWCVLVVLPGVLVAALGGLRVGGDMTTPILVVWIVAYLAQLGVFMAVTRVSERGNGLGWFIASLTPWIVDWSAPFSMVGPILCAAVVVAYSYWCYRASAARKDLEQHGIPAIGVVLEVKKPLMNMVINNVYIRRTMRLRIERSDGVAPYEAKHSGTFMIGNTPDPGDRFNLRVDPSNPNRFTTVDAGVPGPGPGFGAGAFPPPDWGASTAPAGESVADGLQRLADLHASGQLSDAEYSAAKARLLGG